MTLAVIVIRTYTNYKSNLKGYKVGSKSGRYSKYISNGRKCDLVVSLTEIVNVEASRKKL